MEEQKHVEPPKKKKTWVIVLIIIVIIGLMFVTKYLSNKAYPIKNTTQQNNETQNETPEPIKAQGTVTINILPANATGDGGTE